MHVSACLLLLLAAQSTTISIEVAGGALRAGGAMPVRFTIENTGPAEVRVDEPDDYLEGLEITAEPDGRVVKATGKVRGISRRTVKLDPGGFLGRTVDVSPHLDIPHEREGWYRLRWTFGDRSTEPVRVLVVRNTVALVETNHGDLRFEFLPAVAPNHVLHFRRLIRAGLYEESRFHRIIPGFMMQGGIPRDPDRIPEEGLRAELSDRKHVFGTVSTARTDDLHSARSQFFICFAETPHLDQRYTIFGRLVGGEDTVRAIEKVRSDHSPCAGCGRIADAPGATACCGRAGHHADRPNRDVVIKRITLVKNER